MLPHFHHHQGWIAVQFSEQMMIVRQSDTSNGKNLAQKRGRAHTMNESLCIPECLREARAALYIYLT